MGRRCALGIVVLLTAGAAFAAQDAKPAPYTEVEALRIENVRLEGQIVQRAIADWQAKVKALKADLERVRPGFTFNPETGEWAAATPPK